MSTTKKIIFTVLCLLVTSIAFSQKSNKIDSLEKRITSLEEYKVNLDLLYKINSEKLNSEIDIKINEKVKEIDESKKILNGLLYVGIPGTLIGLLIVYFGAIGKAKKLIVNKIENIVEQKREDLIKLIETQEFDSKLRKAKKILVLSTSEESSEKIKLLFSKFKFQQIKFRIVTEYSQPDEYDLIVFDDYDKSFSQELVNDYLSNISDDDVSFVIYTTKTFDRNHRINFSNSPFTLYHNILSTLKYSEILKLTQS